jgi:1-acyl-sn-glycerol-3-phosphate acyltransferase
MFPPAIRTLAVLLYLALALALVMPWFILWGIFTENPDPMYRAAMRAVRFANRLAGIRVCVEGLDNIPSGVCIFAANHASTVDPCVLFPEIPRRVSALVKKEIFRIPIFSIGLRVAQFVSVDRADREAAAASVNTAAALLKGGLSFAIFAEGTRSPDGRLRPFKKGAFIMAIEAGVPIVPVSLAGTYGVMPRGAWTVHPGDVTIRFGPAVNAAAYTLDRRAELLARIESLVAAALPPNQQPLPPTPASIQ